MKIVHTPLTGQRVETAERRAAAACPESWEMPRGIQPLAEAKEKETRHSPPLCETAERAVAKMFLGSTGLKSPTDYRLSCSQHDNIPLIQLISELLFRGQPNTVLQPVQIQYKSYNLDFPALANSGNCRRTVGKLRLVNPPITSIQKL